VVGGSGVDDILSDAFDVVFTDGGNDPVSQANTRSTSLLPSSSLVSRDQRNLRALTLEQLEFLLQSAGG
jgi:hypothetical protein